MVQALACVVVDPSPVITAAFWICRFGCLTLAFTFMGTSELVELTANSWIEVDVALALDCASISGEIAALETFLVEWLCSFCALALEVIDERFKTAAVLFTER